MKYRESGMPEIELWNSFFNPDKVLKEMEINQQINTLIDIGCGYGTFIIPASKIIKGTAIGIDIDAGAIEKVREEIQKENMDNIEILNGDITNPEFMEFLLNSKGQVDYICLFNILHCEEPESLIQKANDLLNIGGKLGITHWIEGDTPRGPSMEIRPKPNQIKQWCKNANFHLLKEMDLPSYHFGQIYEKKGV